VTIAPDVISPDDGFYQQYGDIDGGTVAPLLDAGITLVETVGMVNQVVAPQPSAEKEEWQEQIDVGIHEEGVNGMAL